VQPLLGVEDDHWEPVQVDGSLNAMPKRRSSRSQSDIGMAGPMASGHVLSETLLYQSSWFLDAPDCHVGRSDSRSVAGFRGRHGMRRSCYLLAHRVGERPISISFGSLVSHRHVGSCMTETSHQFFGRCALPGRAWRTHL
jgi:hypothetical protein